MTMGAQGGRGLWLLALAGPVLFLLAIVGLSAWQIGLGTPPEQVGDAVAAQAPVMLLAVLGILGLVCLRLPLAAL